MPKPPFSWAVRMAVRDGRKSWRRLLLYISAASIGIAGMVAVGSFRHNLSSAIDEQAKPLLGADIVIRNARGFTPAADAFFATLPYPQLREIELNTMLFLPAQGTNRLFELRGIEKGYPFYGQIKTNPPEGLSALFDGDAALLDETAMLELGVSVGDKVQIGSQSYRVAAGITAIPGEAMSSVLAAPHAFISLTSLRKTGLIQKESLDRYRVYFHIPNDSERADALAKIEAFEERKSWRVTTVEEREKSLGNRVANAARFLEWAALIALLLGGIGVGSIVFTYARDKRLAAATLRCLGAPSTLILATFAIQGVAMGALGTLLGTALGVALQAAFPFLVGKSVAISIPFFISWPSIASGAAVGFGVTFLFAVLPMLGLRRVPPIEALRVSEGASAPVLKDPLGVLVIGALVGVIFFYSKNVADSWRSAAAVPAMLLASFAVLSLISWVSLRALRANMPWSWPYAWRHGLANLFRPQNQTYVLVPALGLGSALIFFVSFLSSSLLSHIALSTGKDEATLALIDVQKDQQEPLTNLLARENVPLLDKTPFVTMRIDSINGENAAELIKGKKIIPASGRRPDWVLTHEYRSSYRNRLTVSEIVTAGNWPPASGQTDPVSVSLEEGIAKDLNVDIGDRITFNVQGMLLPSVVTALRKVDWFQLRPNFFAVFPEGVLEEAPQFLIFLTRPETIVASADIQKKIRQAFPNVSAVDLRMIMETLKGYFEKVALALQAMSGFVVLTGIMILAAALISTRRERIKDAALLRILGASKQDIQRIHLIEYSLIGFLSGVMGLGIGIAGSFLATKFLFDISFYANPVTMLAGLSLLVTLTVLAGLALGRDVLNRPPLQTIRDEEA